MSVQRDEGKDPSWSSDDHGTASLGAYEMDGRPEGKETIPEEELREDSSCPIQNGTELACVLVGFVVALTCGTPNAWSLTGGEMQEDLDLTDTQVNLITSFGLLGLFFTFFAGLLYDFLGVAPMVGLGCILTSGGYLVMSFGDQDSWLLILFAFMLVGFGSGGAFTSVLGFGLKTIIKSPGFAVSTIGGGMSLSMAFVTVLFLILHAASCDGDCDNGIWRDQLRLLALVSFIIEAPATFILYYLDKKKKPELHSFEDTRRSSSKSGNWELGEANEAELFSNASDSGNYRQEVQADLEEDSLLVEKKKPSFFEKLVVLKSYFFWVLFCTYAVGVGGCLVVLTEMVNIWDSVVEDSPQDREGWIFPISLCFSIVNCFVGGILFGWVSDIFVSRGFPRTKALAFVFLVFSFVFFSLAGTTVPEIPPSSLQIIVMLLLISIGVAFGTMVNTFPTLIGENYNMDYFGLYLGLLQIGVAAATFIVPVICTSDYNRTGNFFGTFCLFGVLYMLSGVALFFVKPLSSSS